MTTIGAGDPYVLGVDLGTTSTAAAINSGGHVAMLELSSLDPAVASVLWLDDDGTFLIGPAAEGRAVTDPIGVAREFKRRFGDPLPLLLRGSPFSADDLTLRLLRFVVERAIEEAGTAPESLVVTHPAEWGPFKRSLLSDSIANSTLPPVTLLTEPEAAAIHYAVSEQLDVGSVVAIYDLGGGTFDVAFLRRTFGGWEFVGRPGGLERLGGVDFDSAVLGHVLSAIEIDFDDLDPDDPDVASAAAQLRRDCVEAKKALSSNTSADIPVFLPGAEGQVRITRTEFEDLIRPALQRSVDAFAEAIVEADLTADAIDRVLLVGGSSRVPLVAQTIAKATGRDVFVDVHPKFAIAMGAAASSGRHLPAVAEPANDLASPPEAQVEKGQPDTVGRLVPTNAFETKTEPAPHRPAVRSRILLGLVILAVVGGLVILVRPDRQDADRASLSAVGASSPSDADDSKGPSASAVGLDSPTHNARGELANNEVYTVRGPQAAPVRRWQFADPTFSPPIVSGDTIYMMSGGDLVAIDVESGRVVWSQERDPNFARMVLGSESLYVTGNDENSVWLDVFDRIDGTPSRLDLRISGWDRNHRVVDLLIERDGIYFLASKDGQTPDASASVLIGLDPSSGEEQWRHDRTGYGNLSPPVFVDGIVATVSEVEVIAVDAASGEERWRSEDGATPLAAITGEPGSFVVQSSWFGEVGTFVFEPETGERRWHELTASSNVVLENGTVYTIGPYAATLEALAVGDGTAIWSVELPDDFIEFNGTVVADEITVYAASGERLDSEPRIMAFDRSDGSLVWDTELVGERWFAVNTPIAVADGSLVVTDSVGLVSSWS